MGKKKSKRKSRKRSRSRDRRSRSRSRDRRSKSRSKRSRSYERSHSRRSRSHSRDRRSRSRERRRSRDRGGRSREVSKGKEDEKTWKFESQAPQPKPEVTLTIADELKRARAIAEIDGESFVQADFRTDHMARLQGVKKEEGAKFDFGTSAEDASGPKVGGGKGVDIGLAHPKLFGDQAKREKRFLERVFALRQAALAGKSK